MISKNILVVEDESHIAEGIKLNLSLQGHDVTLASNGKEALKYWDSKNPHLIVLDLMMPEFDGFKVIEKIRQKDPRVPILVLSALSSPKDKVKCFRMGVDDYLSKPFHLDEFLLRVERLLTQSTWYENQKEYDVFSFGPNKIDFVRSKATTPRGEIDLTEQEIKLLKVFIENQGLPLSRADLLEKGWEMSGDVPTRTVDNFLVRFRKYFEEDPKHPQYFLSKRSVGYLFDPKK